MCDDDEDECIEMDSKTFRTLVIAVAAVFIACTLGCTIAYVTHPKEWTCTMNDYRMCEDK